MKTQEKNFDGIKLSGFTAILIMLALTGTAIYLLSLPQTPSIIAGVICGICVVVMLPGFMIIQPNNSRVLTFFGRDAGTVISNGFYWVNPLFLKSTVTLRILNLNIDPIKVNDKVGNPIMIGAVVVWRIKDTYKASFDISGNIREFVQIQSDAALRQVAGMYAYDTNETIDKVTLRSDESGEITQRLEDELNSRLAIAGSPYQLSGLCIRNRQRDVTPPAGRRHHFCPRTDRRRSCQHGSPGIGKVRERRCCRAG